MGPLASPPARADEHTQAELRQAEHAYASMDYEQALKIANKLSNQRGLNHEELVRVTRLLVLSYTVLGNEEAARASAIQLLMYEPTLKPAQAASPRMQEPFKIAQMYWKEQSQVPGLDTSAEVSVTEPGAIRVTVRDPSSVVRRLVVGYRWGASGAFNTSDMKTSGNVGELSIPQSPSGTARLDYYVQALDARDNVVFESGSVASPKTVLVAATRHAAESGGALGANSTGQGGSIFASPLFWVASALVVAGGAVGSYFLLRSPDQETRERTITLPPTKESRQVPTSVPANHAILVPGILCLPGGC